MKRKQKVYYKSKGIYDKKPCITITNDYLKNYNFQIGDKIEIEYGNSKLIIRQVENKKIQTLECVNS